MSRFEEIGVDKQFFATSIRHAKFLFNQSCAICEIRRPHSQCERCPILTAHTNTLELFESYKKRKAA